jgi:hypothetical protein
MEEANYEITLSFDSFSKLGLFLLDFENWTEYKAKRSERRETDQRGHRTRELHQRARDFQLIHPLLSYRECFRLSNART